METVKLATMAMATRFELVVRGDREAASLRAAGEEALAEIDRLGRQLSFYAETSDVARVNRHAFDGPVPVDAGLFRLLRLCERMHRATDGAFDVTVGPLMRCWGFAPGDGSTPDGPDLERVLAHVGMQHVHLDERARTVRFDVEGVEIDLGGVGKGYAIDEAMWLLIEAGIDHAFLHGGTSSMRAIGRSPDNADWKVAIAAPAGGTAHRKRDDILGIAHLHNRALAVSDMRGKWFETAGGAMGHVLDPRSGRPVPTAGLSAVELDSAAEADALSTALLVLTPGERQRAVRSFEGVKVLVASAETDSSVTVHHSDFLPGEPASTGT